MFEQQIIINKSKYLKKYTMAFVNDSSSELNQFFQPESSWHGWECTDYDVEQELYDIELAQKELSDRFCSDIIMSEVIVQDIASVDVCELQFFEYKLKSEKQETARKLAAVFRRPIYRKGNNKNCCRYLILNAIKAMEIYNLPEDFKRYYRSQRFAFTGFQVLKQHLIIDDNDPIDIQERKTIFRQYLQVFLNQRGDQNTILGSLSILSSKKKQNMKEYLTYKNKIMMLYLNFPEQWQSNQMHQQQQRQQRHQQ